MARILTFLCLLSLGFFSLGLFFDTPVSIIDTASAGKRELIRFYSVNKKGQERKRAMLRGTDEPGCRTIRNIKAHRVMVLGFAWCEVYARRDCEPQSKLIATWGGDRKRKSEGDMPAGRMGQGTRWILNASGNVDVASFQCMRRTTD